VLVQREMDSGRAPLEYSANSTGQLHRRKWWLSAEGAAAETTTGFEKEISWLVPFTTGRPRHWALLYPGSEALR
jgi:hypothetical protein